MNIYRESEVLEMAGQAELSHWHAKIESLPIYRKLLNKTDKIKLCFYDGMAPLFGEVLKTHISGQFVSYDLLVTFPNEEEERLYNIKAMYVEEIIYNKI